MTPARLDHIVINVRFEMNRAEQVFSGLGFCLTPRGHHTLGSVNHLMMFGQDYLELIGLPADAAAQRPEIAEAPRGLNGLVFKSDDIDATHAHLRAVGLAGDPPKSFSRPVFLSDGTARDARFRTVAVRADAFGVGRLYFCQHLTPELLWRAEWQTHANTASGFAELVMVAEAPEAEATNLRRAIGAPEADLAHPETTLITLETGQRLRFLTPEAYARRYGDGARDLKGRTAMFGALHLHVTDLAGLDGIRPTPDITRYDRAGAVHIVLEDFDTLLVFSQ